MYLWERNGPILLRERILFLVSSTVYARSIFMVPKSKADQMSLIYFHCFFSPTEKASKNIATRTSNQKEENWNWIIKSPSRCCWGRSGSNEKEIKHEVREYMHEARDSRHEARDSWHEARDSRHEARDSKHEARESWHKARDSRHEARDSRHEARDSWQSKS